MAVGREDSDGRLSKSASSFNFQIPYWYPNVAKAVYGWTEQLTIEEPGSFQYIMDEMLKANKIPRVIFPESVIQKGTHREESQTTKREREIVWGGEGGGCDTDTKTRWRTICSNDRWILAKHQTSNTHTNPPHNTKINTDINSSTINPHLLLNNARLVQLGRSQSKKK